MIADRNIVNAYSQLFEGLDSITKLELIEILSRSLRKEKKTTEQFFYDSFGAFASNKSAEDIVDDIRTSRRFNKKDLKL